MATAINDLHANACRRAGRRVGRTVGRLRRARAGGLAGAARARPGGGRPDRLGDGRSPGSSTPSSSPSWRWRRPASACFEDKVRQELHRHRVPLRLPEGQAVGRRDRRGPRARASSTSPSRSASCWRSLPITNPTSTALFKAIVAAKTRNAMIFRPSARAARCAARADRDPAGGRRGGRAAAATRCRSSPTRRSTSRSTSSTTPASTSSGRPAGRRRSRPRTRPASRASASAPATRRSTSTAAPTSGWRSSTS